DAQDYADLPRREVLLFLIGQESFATRPGSNQLMPLSGQESQVISEGLQLSFRPLVDQTGLTCEEVTVRDLRQTSSGRIPLPFVHGLLDARLDQGVQTLLCDDEYPHHKRQSDSCPTASAPDNGR